MKMAAVEHAHTEGVCLLRHPIQLKDSCLGLRGGKTN